MPRALNLLRHSITRRPQFVAGLAAAGYEVVERLERPGPTDIVLTWNRSAGFHETATVFEDAGARVVVAENGYLGKSWLGDEWFALSLWHHAGAGQWPNGPNSRWDSLGVNLETWKTGSEIVVFEQRSIGEPDVRSPPGWAESAQRLTGGRIRRHPGVSMPSVSLEDHLSDARCVVTWNSGAALRALLMGVPAFYEFPAWIGAKAALPLTAWPAEPKRCDEARLAMFRRLAWAQWRIVEIESGEAFAALLA